MRTPVHFFTVALKNGHVMSRPKYTSDHAILGDVIQEVEKSAPEAAWVQILFARRDVTRDAVGLKSSMSHAKKDIETPKIDFMSGEERERTELHGDFYRRSDERIKKLDEITSLPTVLMAIQGMWVGEKDQLRDLPFSQCADEVDSLKMFTFHDPRMLIDLVERRMVTDIGRYIAGYTGSRLEPPSFLITVDELPYYANLPWGKYVRAIKSVPIWAAYSPYVERGYVQGEVDPSDMEEHLEGREIRSPRDGRQARRGGGKEDRAAGFEQRAGHRGRLPGAEDGDSPLRGIADGCDEVLEDLQVHLRGAGPRAGRGRKAEVPGGRPRGRRAFRAPPLKPAASHLQR